MSIPMQLQAPEAQEPDRAVLSRLVREAMAGLLLEEGRITLEQVRLLNREADHDC